MSARSVSYATGSNREPPQWRRTLRRLIRLTPLAIVLLTVASAVLISLQWPWLWYGSRDEYQWHRWLRFTMPPTKVVYEEDPMKAASLQTLPPYPNSAYFGERGSTSGTWKDYRSRRGGPPVIYFPPSIQKLSIQRMGLGFLHERSNSHSPRSLIWVQLGWRSQRPPNWDDSKGLPPRTEVFLAGRRCTHDECVPPDSMLDVRLNWNYLRIPLRPDQIMRIYAGQPDPDDAAHFTIKYEIDNLPGTIDGRLEADDTVTLKILDGPAATRPSTIPTTAPASGT